MLEAGALHVRVGEDHLHVAGAGLVGHRGDRAGEGEMIRVPRHAEQLARLEVHADLDGEARVTVQALVRSHARQTTVEAAVRLLPARSSGAPW